MLPLTKLVSSALTGLTTSALTIYFLPESLAIPGKESDLIYSPVDQEDSTRLLAKFTATQSEQLKNLEKYLKKFEEAGTRLLTLIKEEHSNISSFFKKVQDSEESLREFLEQYYKTSAEKLQLEALLNQSKFWNNSLFRVGNLISGWGKSLEQLLCAINDASASRNCSTVGADWYKSTSEQVDATASHLQGGALNIRKMHSKS
ncbi:hypothetical protein [Candidatus Mycoplasma haematominutum]|uniref:Uncharacterized protein n=1 Tax=Candidatus Mycoplasma haematominutum 'Birmingham 1' TaxID=1116213 RepID=G8C3E5_9MOLU|nr:hypothetical protein [Candidatus Mycoplasma haematominutum]CCE66843.1 hypothetical protein MHM_03250 [Candidatus Mycoplasma haematominutum 'Birmingham 1']